MSAIPSTKLLRALVENLPHPSRHKSAHHKNKNRSYTQPRSFRIPVFQRTYREPQDLIIRPNQANPQKGIRLKLQGVRAEYIPLRQRGNKKQITRHQLEKHQFSFQRTNRIEKQEFNQKSQDTKEKVLMSSPVIAHTQLYEQKTADDIYQDIDKPQRYQNQQRKFLINLRIIRHILQRRSAIQAEYRNELRDLQLRNLSLDEKCNMLQYVIKQYQKNNNVVVKDFCKRLSAYDFHWEDKMAATLQEKDRAIASTISGLQHQIDQLKDKLEKVSIQLKKKQELLNLLGKKEEFDDSHQNVQIKIDQINELIDTNYKQKQNITQLSQRVQQLTHSKSLLTSQLTIVEARVQTLEAQNSTLLAFKQQFFQMKERVNQFETELGAIKMIRKQELEEHVAKVQSLEDRISSLMNQLQANSYLKQTLLAKQKEFDDLSAEHQKMVKKLDSLDRELNRQVFTSAKDHTYNQELATKIKEIDQNLHIHVNTIFNKLQYGLDRLSKDEAVSLINQKVQFIIYLNQEKVSFMNEISSRLKSQILLLNREVKLLNWQSQRYNAQFKQIIKIKELYQSIKASQDKLIEAQKQSLRQIKKRIGECQLCQELISRQSELLGQIANEQAGNRAIFQPILEEFFKQQ